MQSAPEAGHHPATLNLPLLSLGMAALLVAQFFSALADNAVLITAIAVAKNQGHARLVPLLQEAFVLPFIALAPFAGPIADGYAKGRVMMGANLAKLVGAAGMALGANPLLAYGLIGVGATAYSPAKYGILSQMFGAERLVRANGMLEGSTIAAILLGVLLGGWLADRSISAAFACVLACYLVATGANLLIPRLPAENPATDFRPRAMLGRFGAALRGLYRDGDARFSLLGTSVFWGSGSTLRLVLFAWVPVALLLNDNQTPAQLDGRAVGGHRGGRRGRGCVDLAGPGEPRAAGRILLGPLVLAMASVGTLGAAALVMGAYRRVWRPVRGAAQCPAAAAWPCQRRRGQRAGRAELLGEPGDAALCRRLFAGQRRRRRRRAHRVGLRHDAGRGRVVACRAALARCRKTSL